jgi:hypothetical protein
MSTKILESDGRRAPALPRKHNELVRQIADSETFRTAPMMRALMLYLWEHQGQSIGEYAIATEALGRSSDFDPKLDSTVRVQIARLRTKLKEFYEVVGDAFPLRLSIPRGTHELKWTYEPPKTSLFTRLQTIPKPYRWAIGVSQLLLLFLCAGLLIQNYRLRISRPAPAASLARFWTSYLVAEKPVTIVIPSPLSFYWPEHQLSIRDLQISEYSAWPTSNLIKRIAEQWGPPESSQSYVGAMEMTAGVRLLQYLTAHGQKVNLIESRKLSVDAFSEPNTIFLGMPRNMVYLTPLLSRTNFQMESVTPEVIRSKQPAPGEKAEFREQRYSSDRRLGSSMMILAPAKAGNSQILVLVGRNLTCLTSLLTTPGGLRTVDEAWTKGGAPKSWEMVVQAELYGDTVLNVAPAAFRPLLPTFWN